MDFLRFLKKNIFKARRISFFFLVNIILLLVLMFLIFVKFKKIWITLFFSLTIFSVRYQRKKMRIPMTFEPVVLFSVVLVRAYGLNYGLFTAIIPIFLSDIFSANIDFSSIISILCKALVMVPVHLFGQSNLFFVTIFSYVVLNEGIGTILSLKAGTPINDILTQLTTSTIIRIIYLQLFLGPLCALLRC